MKPAAALAATIITAIGCSQPTASRVDFIQLSGTLGMMGKVKQPALTICLSGVSATDLPTWTTNLQNAVLKWIKPARDLTTDPLASTVNVVTTNTGCDAFVNVAANQTANTFVSETPKINMSPDGYYGSFNVLLHEFGLAFGLGDTYAPGGFSGQCIPGQPTSVMCDTAYGDLQDDDVQGVRAVYARAFPYDHPLASLYVAAGLDQGGGKFKLGVSAVVVDQASRGGTVSLCVGDSTACSATAGTWTDLTKLRDNAAAAIYATAAGIPLQDGTVVAMRYTLGEKRVLGYVKFADLGSNN